MVTRNPKFGDDGAPEVSVVANLDDIMTCFAVRAAAFVGRGEPMEEEFDGNDFNACTHLLARSEGRPVATMRIRILSAGADGEVCWERLAVLPGHGGLPLLLGLAQAAREYSVAKGAAWAVGAVADNRLYAFWRRQGFVDSGRPPVDYNGVPYRQIRCRLKPECAVDGQGMPPAARRVAERRPKKRRMDPAIA